MNQHFELDSKQVEQFARAIVRAKDAAQQAILGAITEASSADEAEKVYQRVKELERV